MASIDATTNTEPMIKEPSTKVSPSIKSPTEDTLRAHIRALNEKVDVLEAILKCDASLAIQGISHLKNPMLTKTTWEDKLHGLFYDARIPPAWFYNMVPVDQSPQDTDIDMAYIYFINDATKNEAMRRLHQMLHKNYPDNQISVITE